MSKPKLDPSKEITEVVFGEGSHLAVTHSLQGGASNNWDDPIIMKSKGAISQEIIKSLQQITVSLSMEEFLRKFFDMWYSDAELLTKLLGYQTELEYSQEQSGEEGTDGWLEGKLENYTLLKSAHKGDEISPDDLLSILQTQIKFEKGVKELNIDLDSVKPSNGDTDNNLEVSKNKGNIMSAKDDKSSTELLKAAALTEARKELETELKKAKDDLAVELQKSKDEVAKVEAERDLLKAKDQELKKSALTTQVAKFEYVAEAEVGNTVDMLLKSKDSESFGATLALLVKAQEKIDEVKAEFVTADTGAETTSTETVEKSVLDLNHEAMAQLIKDAQSK